MNQKEISKHIKDAFLDIEALTGTLSALTHADPHRFPENFEILSIEACLRAEKIACNIRHFIYTSSRITKKELMSLISQEHDIQVQYENEILSITLPSLLPKKKQINGGEFLYDALYFALQEFAESNEYSKLTNCVICFVHAYGKDDPKHKTRDYDNIETKQVLDIIATFAMTDDSGKFCDTFHRTELSESSYTRIFIMNKNNFTDWIFKNFHTVQNSY